MRSRTGTALIGDGRNALPELGRQASAPRVLRFLPGSTNHHVTPSASRNAALRETRIPLGHFLSAQRVDA